MTADNTASPGTKLSPLSAAARARLLITRWEAAPGIFEDVSAWISAEPYWLTEVLILLREIARG